MEHPVDVRAVPAPQPPSLDELYKAELLEEMQVPLDGPYRPAQSLGQSLHLGPAQASLIVGIIGEGAVGGYRLGRDTGHYEVAHLGYARKLGLRWHDRLLFVVRRCALVICDGKIHQSGGLRLKIPRRLFMSFVWRVL